MESIIVAVDCESYTPGLGKTEFSAGTRIEPADPSYFPLLWAGLAVPEDNTVVFDADLSARLKLDRDKAKES
jgi:hypothetical protein